LVEKGDIKQSVTTLKSNHDTFRSVYDEFTKEATKLSEKDCGSTYDVCMEIVLKTKGKLDGATSLPKDQLEDLKRNRD